MSRVAAVAGREFRSYLLSPTGYVIIAIFALFAGAFFIRFSFDQGQRASLRPVFELGMWLLLLVCPAITMKAICEERRLGTLEMLMTSPVSESEVVAGKFLGAAVFLALLLAPTLAHVVILELYGRPDYGELFSGYLGLLLAGAAYLASGILASVLSATQVMAFLLTFFFWLALNVGSKLLPQYLGEPWATAAYAADPDPRLRDFAIGLIDSSNVIYFVSLTVLFLIAAVRAMQVRRWP